MNMNNKLVQTLLNIENIALRESENELALHRITQINAILTSHKLNSSKSARLLKIKGRLADVYNSGLPLRANSLLATYAAQNIAKFLGEG